MAIFVTGFLKTKLVNLGQIDFLLGLPLDINVNDEQNKFKVHISINIAKITNYQPKIGHDATFFTFIYGAEYDKSADTVKYVRISVNG